MQEAFWHLNEKPYGNSPDPKSLFPSAEHRQAVRVHLHTFDLADTVP